MIGDIQILRGNPNPTELATVLAVLCAMRRDAAPKGPGRVLPARWEDRYRSTSWFSGV